MALISLAARLGFWILLTAITVFSLLPLEFAVQSGLSDKVDHLLGYAALTAARRIGYPSRRHPLMQAAWIIAYGMAIEYAQSFIPGRMMSGWDVVANSAGVLLGLVLAWLVIRLLSRRSR